MSSWFHQLSLSVALEKIEGTEAGWRLLPVSEMARIFEYFVVCGIGPEIRTLYEEKGFHGTGIMYLPSLLDQYPPSDHKLYPPPPPQLPMVSLQTLPYMLNMDTAFDQSTFIEFSTSASFAVCLAGWGGILLIGFRFEWSLDFPEELPDSSNWYPCDFCIISVAAGLTAVFGESNCMSSFIETDNFHAINTMPFLFVVALCMMKCCGLLI